MVDDDTCAAGLLSALLRKRFPQAQIHFAADGKAGLDAVLSELPDIVITDINMPEMDGIQLLNSIAAIKPDTGVIVVTAYSDKQTYDRIASSGISAEIIPKPIVFETLMTAVKRFADFITV